MQIRVFEAAWEQRKHRPTDESQLGKDLAAIEMAGKGNPPQGIHEKILYDSLYAYLGRVDYIDNIKRGKNGKHELE